MSSSTEFVDEDAPPTSLPLPSSEDYDPADEAQDFRFLSLLTTGSSSAKIPKRGEKDFEPHGTRAQDSVLEASREAMYDALSYVRFHTGASKSTCRGWYFGAGVEGREELLKEKVRGRIEEEGYVVFVEEAKGPMFKCMGVQAKGIKDNRSMWLRPEEALYLIERGGLDLYWPACPEAVMKGEYQSLGSCADGAVDDEEKDIPLSLQAAWALLVGEEEGNHETVAMDHYTVYANLKRNGYAVLRAIEYKQPPATQSSIFNIFSRLFGAYFTKSNETALNVSPKTPLVARGLYRNYSKIYAQLSLIPYHVPTPRLTTQSTPTYPYKMAFDIWKTTRVSTFQKSAPGLPDFRAAIVSANHTTLPTLQELTALLESTPWDPPFRKEWMGEHRAYVRIKHGYRNVLLAVVDNGITSFLRLSEGGLGQERMWERFDRGARGGGKGGRGGFRGRGQGRGRGRARGGK